MSISKELLVELLKDCERPEDLRGDLRPNSLPVCIAFAPSLAVSPKFGPPEIRIFRLSSQ